MIKKIKSILLSGTSKDAFISLIGNALIALAGMIFSIIVARALAPAGFGVFSAIFAIATILGSLGDIGVTSALINFLPKQPNNRQAIISIAFWAQVSIGIVLFLAVLVLIPLHSIIVPHSQIVHFLLLGLMAIVLCVEVFSIAVFRAEKKFFWASLIASIDSWGKLVILGILLLFFPPLNIVSILLAALCATTFASIVGLSFEFKGIRRIFPREQAKEIFKFTKWITLMQVFNVFIGRLDIVLLNALHSAVAAGIFAAASRVTLVFVLLVSSLGSVVSPRFSGFNEKAHVKRYLKKLLLMIGGIALFMASTSLFAPLIINLVFGPEYASAVPVFRALTLSMIPFLFTIITVNPLIYTFNKPDFIAKLSVIQVFLIILIDVLLIPKFGAYAPAISLAVTNSFVLLLTGLKLRQLLK